MNRIGRGRAVGARAAVTVGLLAAAAAMPAGPPPGAALAADAGAAPPTAAPASRPDPASRPAQQTYREAYQRLLAFQRQTLAEAYKAVGHRDPKWDAAAIAFLDHMAEQFATSWVPYFYKPDPVYGHDRGIPDAAALVAAGCDDPLVLYCYGAMLMDGGRSTEALPLLRKAGAGMRRAKYPTLRVAMVPERLRKLTLYYKEQEGLAARATADLVAACCGPQAAAGRRSLAGVAWERLGNDRTAQQAFVDALAARPDADPWIKGVLAGRLHVKLAWDSRGAGGANGVSPEGWRGFFEHLGLARDELTAAWKADPTLAEAPEEMIWVAMGGGEQLDEKPLDWFARAVEAQVDWTPAYEAMLTGPLLPRWGGSHEAMLQLGEACLADPRYDTLVPWQYVYAVARVGEDAGRPWALLEDPAVYAKVAAVGDGYVKAANGRVGDYYATAHAAAAWRTEKWGEARKALDALAAAKRYPHEATFAYFGAADGHAEIARVYARTGPKAAAVVAAEAAIVDDPAAAAAAYRAALAAVDPKDFAADYLKYRAERLEAEAKFAAGDWLPLVPGAVASGWSFDTGQWAVSPDRSLGVRTAEPGPIQARWIDPIARRLGPAYEVAGTLDFKMGDKPALGYNAGLLLFGPDGTGPAAAVVLRRLPPSVSFSAGNSVHTEKTEMSDTPSFRFRVEGHTFTLWVDEQQVDEPRQVADGWPPELNFGLGGHTGVPLTFKDLKVRRLPAGGAGKKPAAKPAAR